MELVRAILFAIEAAPSWGSLLEIEIPGSTDEEVSYHVMLLHKAALVEAVDCSSMARRCWKPSSLTWEGHEFTEAIHSDTLWNKAKTMAWEKTGTVTIEILKAVVPLAWKMMLGTP
jgi:hypothetical protein